MHGLGDAAGGPAGCPTTTVARGRVTARALRALTWPWRARGRVLVTVDPDTSPAAWLASRLRRRRWVADVHEDYASLLRDRTWVAPAALGGLVAVTKAVTRLSGRADVTLVADAHVPPPTARRRLVVRNEPDFTLLPAPIGPRPLQARAVYVGDVRSSRGLRTMVDAVAATSADETPWSLDIVGPVARTDADWLAERLRRPDAARVTAHGRLDPAASWRLAVTADVGLCLLADTPAFHDTMPSKVYEYLACGMPVIATPLPRVASLLTDTGAGLVVSDAASCSDALRRVASEEGLYDRLREQAGRWAREARTRPSVYDEAAAVVAELARR